MDDLISRADVEALFRDARKRLKASDYKTFDEFNTRDLMLLNAEQLIHILPSVSVAEKVGRWIPVSERLPDNTDPVNITWVNHDPESYYADIKDKPFTATGHYCNGRWWWYSADCQDYLDEYGHCDVDAMDDAIEVIAWMPLPQPYKAESEE